MLRVLDYTEGGETDSVKEPDRVLIICGTGKPESMTKKEFWVAVKAAKKFGLIGNDREMPAVVPMAK